MGDNSTQKIFALLGEKDIYFKIDSSTNSTLVISIYISKAQIKLTNCENKSIKASVVLNSTYSAIYNQFCTQWRTS